jgi:hypothetical protein
MKNKEGKEDNSFHGNVCAYLTCRLMGDPNRSTLNEVARYFARDAATLGTLIGRLSGRMKADEGLRREIEKLTKKVAT